MNYFLSFKVYVFITETYYLKSHFIERLCTQFIIILLSGLTMVPSIDFDDEMLLQADEINDKIAYNMLSSETIFWFEVL